MSSANLIRPKAEGGAVASAKKSSHHITTLEAVSDALSQLRYGTVQLTVHDSKVVQLDVTERHRFT